MDNLLVTTIRAYQRFVSPALAPQCRFSPTCSQYAVEAIREHGTLVGSAYALWRVLRCQPCSKGGYDPVPMRRRRPGVH